MYSERFAPVSETVCCPAETITAPVVAPLPPVAFVAPSGFVQAPYLCADANRHDYVDTTLGLRMNLLESIVLTLGVFHPLNDQGVRAAGWSPIASVEGTF